MRRKPGLLGRGCGAAPARSGWLRRGCGAARQRCRPVRTARRRAAAPDGAAASRSRGATSGRCRRRRRTAAARRAAAGAGAAAPREPVPRQRRGAAAAAGALQLLQLLDVLRQLGHARRVRPSSRAPSTDLGFGAEALTRALAQRQLVGRWRAAACLRSSTAACTLPVGLARGLLGLGRRHAAGQPLAVGAEVGALRLDDLRASAAGDLPWPLGAEGTVSTTPAFSRFMLLSTKACGLARYSATSIWSSETPARCVRAGDAATACRRAGRGTRRRRLPTALVAPLAPPRRGAAATGSGRRCGGTRRGRRGAPAAARGAGAGHWRGGAVGGAGAAEMAGATAGAGRGAGGGARASADRTASCTRAPGDRWTRSSRGSRRRTAPARRDRWSRAGTAGHRRGAAASPACPAAPRCSRRRQRGRPRAARRARAGDEASSGVMLVTSISARSVSPSADCTARRPRPSAQACEAARASAASGRRRSGRSAPRDRSSVVFQGVSQWTAADAASLTPSTTLPSTAPRAAQPARSQQTAEITITSSR